MRLRRGRCRNRRYPLSKCCRVEIRRNDGFRPQYSPNWKTEKGSIRNIALFLSSPFSLGSLAYTVARTRTFCELLHENALRRVSATSGIDPFLNAIDLIRSKTVAKKESVFSENPSFPA